MTQHCLFALDIFIKDSGYIFSRVDGYGIMKKQIGI